MPTGSIQHLSQQILKEIEQRLPDQRKNQREGLALMVATMLEVRSPNTMDLAAALPRATERIDMRCQWIERFLKNAHLVPVKVMFPFSRDVLTYSSRSGIVVIQMDQSHLNDAFEVLMISVAWQGRALPVLWTVQRTQGGIGFKQQKQLLEKLRTLLPLEAKIVLMGDRFYGTPDLIAYCQEQGWDYRLRLKNNLLVFHQGGECTTGELAQQPQRFYQNIELTEKQIPTHVGIVHEEGHPEPWIIAMSAIPSFYRTLDYGLRWGIEPLFSDFKSRGFELAHTQLQFADRLERLILIMALAMYFAVSTGMWEEVHHPLPHEKKLKNPKNIIDGWSPSLNEAYVA